MLYFIICALAVSASVFYSGFHVIKESKTHRRTLKRISVRSGAVSNGSKKGTAKYSNKESNTNKVARVTMVTACLGVACAAIQIYAMAEVFKVRARLAKIPEPWPWWSYVTIFRLIELGLAGTMAYTVSQPKKGGTSLNEMMRCCSSMQENNRRDTFTDSGLTVSESTSRGIQRDSTTEDQNQYYV